MRLRSGIFSLLENFTFDLFCMLVLMSECYMNMLKTIVW